MTRQSVNFDNDDPQLALHLILRGSASFECLQVYADPPRELAEPGEQLESQIKPFAMTKAKSVVDQPDRSWIQCIPAYATQCANDCDGSLGGQASDRKALAVSLAHDSLVACWNGFGPAVQLESADSRPIVVVVLNCGCHFGAGVDVEAVATGRRGEKVKRQVIVGVKHGRCPWTLGARRGQGQDVVIGELFEYALAQRRIQEKTPASDSTSISVARKRFRR